MTVEVQLLKYKFRFRALNWREEVALKFPPNTNPLRHILAAALVDVSGLPVSSAQEAMKIFKPMPTPILDRVYKIYKDKLPRSRRFETAALYRAPEPQAYVAKLAQDDERVENTADEAVRRMEAKFGKEEVQEAADVAQQVLRGSKLRGAIKK